MARVLARLAIKISILRGTLQTAITSDDYAYQNGGYWITIGGAKTSMNGNGGELIYERDITRVTKGLLILRLETRVSCL